MIDEPTPEAFIALRRQQLLDLTPEEFRLWQHHPITAAYLQFLADMIDRWREIAADMVEEGAFQTRDQHEDKNPDVVRGRIIMMRVLHQIDIKQIQRFYGVEPEETDEAPETDDS